MQESSGQSPWFVTPLAQGRRPREYSSPKGPYHSRTTYIDPLGTSRTWEHAERPTRPRSSDIDAVGMVAILETETGRSHTNPGNTFRKAGREMLLICTATGPELLLQKQYRPPIDKVCIEVPAGLVDAGETAEQAAVRELREETGYVGVVSESSPVMFNDPGFCNTNLRMVHLAVDLSAAENQEPRPRLESGEFIECFSVPLKDLYAECKHLEGRGFAIDARVATLAEGMEIARRWKL
ncbi:ADP-ribose pyrophosphatase [Diplocarpon mali]|nr:ADP-ribose pyrophosphatase [Diplocarpon mali]